MSCNGCRVLRKGCNDNCILRQSLQGIEGPQAQANATVFVAKFFGRAGLISFLSAVPQSQRPALFQSLLFEACGRTVNPVNGAVGLLWTGNWQLCQAAVDTVFRGGLPRPLPEFVGQPPDDGASELTDNVDFLESGDHLRSDRKKSCFRESEPKGDLDLCLTRSFPARMTGCGRVNRRSMAEKRRPETPSLNSDESETTTLESGAAYCQTLQGPHSKAKLLRLFF